MFEEKDFITRQIQKIAKTLGKFLGLEQVKDIIEIDQDQLDAMTDNELDTIILTAKLESIMINSGTTTNEMAEQLNIEPEELELFLSNDKVANEEELLKMKDFIANNREFL